MDIIKLINNNNLFKNSKVLSNYFVILIFMIMFFVSFVLRIPKPIEENWRNSDATYHVLLTLHAYDETPISQHKFLPLVSLGESEDKNIQWGATVPDTKGNYYYTSFPPLSFAIPYVLMKVVALPFNEFGLYVLNSILFLSCWLLTIYLFSQIFKGKMSTIFVTIVVSLFYLFSLETIHSQGIVYWPHSLFQVIFILHCITFLKIKNNNKKNLVLFLLLSFLAPSVEWTGYLSNFGFIVATGIKFKTFMKKEGKIKFDFKSFLIMAAIASLTILAFVGFCSHYLTTINSSFFWQALKSRFIARNITSNVGILMVLKSYLESYMSGLLILAILILITIFRADFWQKIKEYKLIFIILSFPLLENIIMSQHAYTYSYDRLKGIFIIILLSLVSLNAILKASKKHRILIQNLFICILTVASIYNMYIYIASDNYYKWKDDAPKINKEMAEYIDKRFNKQNSVIGQSTDVRGYSNLLFHRGIYEDINEDFISKYAIKENKEYAILLKTSNIEATWGKYHYFEFVIYDVKKNTKTVLTINNGELKETNLLDNQLMVVNLTDENWNGGIMCEDNVLLVENTKKNIDILKDAKTLTVNNVIANIVSVVPQNSLWIYVKVNGNKEVFTFPNTISIGK